MSEENPLLDPFLDGSDGEDTFVGTDTQAADAMEDALQERPYLQVFGPDTGVFEFYLPFGSVTVGRSDHADIWLPHHTVSRVHATISLDRGQYVLEDANSNYGTIVNNKRVDSHVLRHGDSIQISMYVLQYRTHQALPGAAIAAARAKLLLRSKFCMLPSAMRLKIRFLEVSPGEIFKPGDTLKIGHGGLLIPITEAPPENVILELHMIWPNQKSRRYLGEILGVIPHTMQWMCVKLHVVPRELHEAVVGSANPSDWIDIAAT